LSKSGVGVSAGIKGLRYGIRPDGRAYIHGGRYGLYYRQELGGGQRRSDGESAASCGSPTEVYDTISAAAIGKLSQTTLVELLTDSYTWLRWDYLLFSVAAISSLLAFVVSPLFGALVLVASIGMVVMTAVWETNRRTVCVHYDMHEQMSDVYRQIVDSLNALAACQQVWALTRSTKVETLTEYKRHAGASRLVDRCAAYVGEGTPPWVETNIQVPTIHSRGQTLYFLPDGVLAYDRSGIGFIDYSDLRISADSTSFIEDAAPSDAKVLSYTWQHPNKDGGPDRRFASNRQVPVCLYGNVALFSTAGLILLIQTSRYDAPARLESGLSNVAATVRKAANRQSFRPTIDVNAERFQSASTALWSVFGSIAAKCVWVVHSIDVVLRKMVGEQNDILHQFVRILAVCVLAGLFILSLLLLRSLIG
jgi:hypothetical protein